MLCNKEAMAIRGCALQTEAAPSAAHQRKPSAKWYVNKQLENSKKSKLHDGDRSRYLVWGRNGGWEQAKKKFPESLTISFSSLGVCPWSCRLCEIYWVVDFYCLDLCHAFVLQWRGYLKKNKILKNSYDSMNLSYAWIIKVVDIFKETDVFMTSRELPLNAWSHSCHRKRKIRIRPERCRVSNVGTMGKEQSEATNERDRCQCMRPSLGLWQHRQVETSTWLRALKRHRYCPEGRSQLQETVMEGDWSLSALLCSSWVDIIIVCQ